MKKVLLFGGIGLFVLLAALIGVYLVFVKNGSKKAPQYDPTAPTITSDREVLDYDVSSVDETIATNAGNAENTYNDLISKAFLKQEVKRYDEALAYYEAAAKNAPNDELRDEANKLIYYMAVESNDAALTEQYKSYLGEKLNQNLVESAGESARQ